MQSEAQLPSLQLCFSLCVKVTSVSIVYAHKNTVNCHKRYRMFKFTLVYPEKEACVLD